MPQDPSIVASFSDTSRVHIWNISLQLQSLKGSSSSNWTASPLFTYDGHSAEGTALAWSPHSAGRLLTADGHGQIQLWRPRCSMWRITRIGEHEAAVEQLEWSPTKSDVFASCSSDGTICIWNIQQRKLLQWKADQADVNCIAWNVKCPHLLASGGEDGSIKVWDISKRQHQGIPTIAVECNWHDEAIIFLQWSPYEASCLAASSMDDTLTIWDFEYDKEEDEEEDENNSKSIPGQLMFVHQGQKHINEFNWHPLLPGVLCSTASNCLHIFKSCNYS